MGYIILEFLAETIATHLPAALPSLAPVLLAGLGAGDSPAAVQAQALKACGALMTATADSELVLHFADLIPPMLDVLRARCATGDEDVVAEVLEVTRVEKSVPAMHGLPGVVGERVAFCLFAKARTRTGKRRPFGQKPPSFCILGFALPARARVCACAYFSPTHSSIFTFFRLSLILYRQQVLDELAQTPVPVLNKHVPAIVAFLLEMVKADALEATTRDQAGMCLNTLAEHKPKLLGKKGLVPPILEAMLHLMASTHESAAGSLNLALADNQHDPAEGALSSLG